VESKQRFVTQALQNHRYVPAPQGQIKLAILKRGTAMKEHDYSKEV
jgi:hypothetical protein